MTSWRPIFERLGKAMEFANISSLRELQTLLEGEPTRSSVEADALAVQTRQRPLPPLSPYAMTLKLTETLR